MAKQAALRPTTVTRTLVGYRVEYAGLGNHKQGTVLTAEQLEAIGVDADRLDHLLEVGCLSQHWE